jgi:phosphonopyruvate decarboxylase
MIAASDFLTICKQHSIDFFSGTPCSYLKPLINEVIDDPEIDYYGATNEGDAVAIVCGASMLKRKGVVMFQNSGLGNAVNPLTSLSFPFKFPFLMIVTHRGQPGGPPDEPQHELMGQITEKMLETMRIKWEYFPRELEELKSSVDKAVAYMEETNKPFAYVLQKGTINPQDLKLKKSDEPLGTRNLVFEEKLEKPYSQRPTRTEALQALAPHLEDQDFIVATTGKTGRELYTLSDSGQNLYMVGSMGCASSFALGAALCSKDKRWIVLDGDAAALMRMGNLATIGACNPSNFLHILLDNEVNDSTGGQTTVSDNVALAAVAKSCGYKGVYSTDSIEELDSILKKIKRSNGPDFIHFRIKKGSPKELGRPGIKPFEVKERMMQRLAET